MKTEEESTSKRGEEGHCREGGQLLQMPCIEEEWLVQGRKRKLVLLEQRKPGEAHWKIRGRGKQGPSTSVKVVG